MAVHSKDVMQAALKDGLDAVLTHLDGLQAHPGWKYFSDYLYNRAKDAQTTILLAIRTAEKSEELGLIAKFQAGRIDGMLYAIERGIEQMQTELRALAQEEGKANAGRQQSGKR